MLQASEKEVGLNLMPADCHSFEYYDYLSRVSVQEYFVSNDSDKKTNIFFDQLLENVFDALRNEFLASIHTQKIAFITVSHIVHHTPFFLRAIRKLGPIAAVIPKGESRGIYRDNLRFFQVFMRWYQHIMRKDINRESINSFEKAKAFLQNVLPPQHKAIIIDEGGYFSPFVKDLTLPENSDDVFANNCILGIVEITKNGHFRWLSAFNKMSNNRVPVISIATSKIKKKEDQEIGEAIIRNFDEILDRDAGTALRYQNVGVFGCGVIGTAVVQALNQRKPENKIHLYDLNPESCLRAGRLLQENRFVIHQNRIEFLQSCNIIISATGSRGLTEEDFNHHILNNVIIACVTSKDDEIATDALKGYLRNDQVNAEFTESFVNSKGKRIHLALGGNAVNFLSHSAVGPGIYQVLASTLICALRFVNRTSSYPALSQLNLISEEDMNGVIKAHELIYGQHKSETVTFGLYPSSRKFVGRHHELQCLRKILNEKYSGIISQGIAGFGGMGKTALARRYAIQSFNEGYYDFIFWVNANNEHTVYQDFLKVAQYFKINFEGKSPSAIISAVYHELFYFARVLIVFDDVPNCRILNEAWIGKDKVNFMPSISKNLIHCVITTMDKKFMRISDNVIELGKFDNKDAVELVQSELSNVSQEDAGLLADCVGFFPLALCQAIAYLLQNPGCSVMQYIQFFKNIEVIGDMAIFQDETLSPTDHQKTVYRTWKLSMKFIEKKYPLSESIFNILSYFSSHQIPVEVIKHFANVCTDFMEDSILQALECLARFSLIDVMPDKRSFNLHALVQAIAVADLVSSSNKIINIALMLIKHTVEHTSDLEAFIPHADRIVQHHENPRNEVISHLCVEKIEVLKRVAAYQHYRQFFSKRARDNYLLAKTICLREQLLGYLIPIQSGLANAYSGYGDLIMYIKSLDSLLQADDLKSESILRAVGVHGSLEDFSNEDELKSAIKRTLEKMTVEMLVSQIDVQRFLVDLNFPPQVILFLPLIPPKTSLYQLLQLGNIDIQGQSVSELFQFLLKPSFKQIRVNFLPDILMGLGLSEPAIAYCIFQGKFDKAALFAKEYYEQLKLSENKINRVGSTYMYVLTHVLQENILEDAETLLLAALDLQSQIASRFWNDQICLLLSTVYAIKGDYERCNKVMFGFLDQIESYGVNTNPEGGLQRRLKVVEKFLLFYKEKFLNASRVFSNAFRILGRTFYALENPENQKKIFLHAKTCFTNALENNPDCVLANFEYGFLLMHHGKFNKALPFLTKSSCCENQVYSFGPKEMAVVPAKIKRLFEQNSHQVLSFSLKFLSLYFEFICTSRLGKNRDLLFEKLKNAVNKDLEDVRLWKALIEKKPCVPFLLSSSVAETESSIGAGYKFR
jgi:hypothetical protein